jgi:Secretion system C-terminal sorting domain
MEVSINLKEESSVDIEITDLTGRNIPILKNKVLPSGQHNIKYDCGKLPTGVYLCKTQIGNDAPKTIKVIVNR